MVGTHYRWSDRRGLAPLELVLALPILLGVLALMINIRNAACWKVRALVQDRNAAWRERWPRTGDRNPQPPEWPVSGALDVQHSALPQEVDVLANQPLVHGQWGNVSANTQLAFNRGVLIGIAKVSRELPMQSRWLGLLGQFAYDLRHLVLDDKFQHRQMGLYFNISRRIPLIYERVLYGQSDTEGAYHTAVAALQSSWTRGPLAVLDHDEELYQLQALLNPTVTPQYIDFHPIGSAPCGLDVDSARLYVEQTLIEQGIHWLPVNMAKGFIAIYQARINQLKAQIPQPAGEIAALQAKIDQLQKFQARVASQL